MKREAKETLSEAGITTSQSFDSLAPYQLSAIQAEAARAYQRKHGKPMPSDNETYIRKRFDLLQVRART